MTLDPEQVRAFAKGYAAAWCRMDPEQVAEHFAPEGSLTINDGPPAVSVVPPSLKLPAASTPPCRTCRCS
jgi:hypothetical protein